MGASGEGREIIMTINWPKGPLYWTGGKTLYVSIPFTWNLPQVRKKVTALWFPRVIVGGPAVRLMPDYFQDLPHVTVGGDDFSVMGMISPLVTRTTSGCPNACAFCGVTRICGEFREFDRWPSGNVLIDDNLLAASNRHFERVIDDLVVYGEADFNQGLDARLLTVFHAEQLRRIDKPIIRLALDSFRTADDWLIAIETLRRAGIPKSRIRSYALIGFNADPDEAWERCKFIERHVRYALPMWFHELDAMQHNTITPKQAALGWNDFERRRIMEWFYKHKSVEKISLNAS